MFPMLRADRPLLRSWCPADRQAFARMNADPEVMEFFVAPLTREESDAFVDRIEARFAEHGFGVWAVKRSTRASSSASLAFSTRRSRRPSRRDSRSATGSPGMLGVRATRPRPLGRP